jgi:hypothetical protein
VGIQLELEKAGASFCTLLLPRFTVIECTGRIQSGAFSRNTTGPKIARNICHNDPHIWQHNRVDGITAWRKSLACMIQAGSVLHALAVNNNRQQSTDFEAVIVVYAVFFSRYFVSHTSLAAPFDGSIGLHLHSQRSSIHTIPSNNSVTHRRPLYRCVKIWASQAVIVLATLQLYKTADWLQVQPMARARATRVFWNDLFRAYHGYVWRASRQDHEPLSAC